MSTPGTELTTSAESGALVPQPHEENCANCGAPIYGKFCVSCGQRVQHQVHSLSEFLGEAAEVITHADSRLWQTFKPLLFQPGFLTQQYLAGRRASYLPPFRLYIVLSVVFFLMVSLSIRMNDFKVVELDQKDATAQIQKQIDESKDPEEQAALRSTLAAMNSINSRLTAAPGASNCRPGTVPEWMKPYLPRLVAVCEKIQSDNGRELSNSLIHNAGRALFVFLPLIALLMKLLYWHPRRHYVEHLLLLLHNHAFVFLSLSALLAFQLAVHSDRAMHWARDLLWFYTLWYMYRSMRRVYAQGRARTFMKFCVLACAYFVCGMLTFFVALIFSAATL